MSVKSALFGALAIAAGGATSAGAEHAPKLETVESRSSFEATLTQLKAAIESRNLKLFAVIDHAAGAEKAGLSLAPTTVVLFGNPQIGTNLMTSAQTAGLDLPLKILVYETAEGETKLAYTPPSVLAANHGIEDRPDVIERMTGALAAIAEEAGQGE